MIGLILLCVAIALGLYATDRLSARCRDEQWRDWLQRHRRGPAPDGLDRFGHTPTRPRRRYERIPD